MENIEDAKRVLETEKVIIEFLISLEGTKLMVIFGAVINVGIKIGMKINNITYKESCEKMINVLTAMKDVGG